MDGGLQGNTTFAIDMFGRLVSKFGIVGGMEVHGPDFTGGKVRLGRLRAERGVRSAGGSQDRVWRRDIRGNKDISLS